MNKVWRNFLLVVISLFLSAVVCQYKGDEWEEGIRTTLYKITRDSIPDYAKENIDEKGIPFVYYREQNGIRPGNQYNATIVCNYALDYYKAIKENKDSTTKKKFLNCVEWLANNITIKDNYGLYQFKWQQPWYPSVKAPYTSGMTSGRAIEVFTYAHNLYPSENYLHYARLLLNGLYIPIQTGGFTYKEPAGWWYEEIADKGLQTPRILDGHIFAILGVHQYWLATKDDSAAYIIQKGLQSLKHNLPLYDAGGGKIYYEKYHKIADKKYHKIITAQMKQLYDITKDPVFAAYYNQWNATLKQPYIYRRIKEKNRSGIILYLLVTGIVMIVLLVVNRLVSKRMSVKHTTHH